jgi:hypothetical protein
MGPFQAGADYTIARQVMQAQRRAGALFDEAWAHAMKMVSANDRGVLEMTRHAWEQGYNREAFHTGASFATMADAADEHHDTTRMAV